jgi:cobalt-zinc-cadmium efflux system membrane fusion protein
MKKIYIVLFVLVNVSVFSSCASKTKEVPEDKHNEEENEVVLTASQFKGVDIQFGKIELKNLSSVITVNGMLDVPPQNMVSVSALMGGFIKTTDLLQGMLVKKGQVIATIQNPDFIQIQSQYLENKQKLKFLELEYKRQEELSKENVSAAKIFQQVSSDYNSLKATIGGQEERLKILNIDPASLTQSNIRSVVAIYAPIGGYVTVVNVNIGKYVNPQDVICEIVDTDHLHAELTVFEKDIIKLKKGQKIRFVLVNESNKERTASVFLINHKISEDRTIRVHAHLDKEDPTLMPNMYLKALIEVEDHKNNALPDQAIVSSGDKNYIFVKTEKENVFKAVEIQKGISENGYTEVVLPENFKIENTEVVIKGAYDLLSKMNNSEEEHAH